MLFHKIYLMVTVCCGKGCVALASAIRSISILSVACFCPMVQVFLRVREQSLSDFGIGAKKL